MNSAKWLLGKYPPTTMWLLFPRLLMSRVVVLMSCMESRIVTLPQNVFSHTDDVSVAEYVLRFAIWDDFWPFHALVLRPAS